MLIVLTEKKKTDFAHMLVLKRMLVPIKMLTVHMFAPLSSLTKRIENAGARSG